MKYTLAYDRHEVVYTVRWGDGEEVFRMPFITQLWNFLGNTLEPGDTLYWEHFPSEDVDRRERYLAAQIPRCATSSRQTCATCGNSVSADCIDHDKTSS